MCVVLVNGAVIESRENYLKYLYLKILKEKCFDEIFGPVDMPGFLHFVLIKSSAVQRELR